MNRILKIAALVVALGATPALAEVIDATVYTQKGEVPLRLELAATPQTRIKGLMDRDSIAPLDGMVFIFPTPHDYTFWMKDTRIPLDMLFVNEKQSIVHIEANVTPYTKAERGSGQEVVTVIELDGGRAARESIAKGDHVRYDLPTSFHVE